MLCMGTQALKLRFVTGNTFRAIAELSGADEKASESEPLKSVFNSPESALQDVEFCDARSRSASPESEQYGTGIEILVFSIERAPNRAPRI
jgi:hypothetical protein